MNIPGSYKQTRLDYGVTAYRPVPFAFGGSIEDYKYAPIFGLAAQPPRVRQADIFRLYYRASAVRVTVDYRQTITFDEGTETSQAQGSFIAYRNAGGFAAGAPPSAPPRGRFLAAVEGGISNFSQAEIIGGVEGSVNTGGENMRLELGVIISTQTGAGETDEGARRGSIKHLRREGTFYEPIFFSIAGLGPKVTGTFLGAPYELDGNVQSNVDVAATVNVEFFGGDLPF